MNWDRHIGFFCSSISWGGLEMNVARYAKLFRERGCEVSVFAVKGSPLAKAHKSNGFKVHKIEHHRKYFDTSNIVRWSKLIKDHDIDVMWLRDTRDLQIAGLANKLAGKKSKIIYQQAMQLGVDKKDIFHTIRFKRIDRWIAPLSYLADQVKSRTNFNSKKISIIPLGVDSEKFRNLPDQSKARTKLNLPLDAVILGMVGRIDPLKGQTFVIDILEQLQNQFPDLHVAFVGEPTKNEGDDYFKKLKKRIKMLNLSDRIHFVPFMSDVEKAYAAFDISMIASKGETFGMVTIEAMMAGLPVVGTASSGTPEILSDGKHGLLYSPDNLAEAVDCVKKLLEEPDFRKKLGVKAQKKALKTYELDKVTDELLEMVKNL